MQNTVRTTSVIIFKWKSHERTKEKFPDSQSEANNTWRKDKAARSLISINKH